MRLFPEIACIVFSIFRCIDVSATCMEDCKDVSKQMKQKTLNRVPIPLTTRIPRTTSSTTCCSSHRQTQLYPWTRIKGRPLVVYTEIYLEDLNSFRPVTMDFRLDFFLKHHWSASDDTCSSHLDGGKSFLTPTGDFVDDSDRSIIIKAKEVKHVWLPDTYIGNSKVVETPAKDSSTSFIIVKRKGKKCAIEYTMRLAAIISCQMNFKYYPVDIQVCPFNLRSFSYPKEMVVYVWDQEGPPPVNPEMRMLRHRVAISKGKSEIHMLNMTYSMLYVNLTFERDLAHHLIQVFTPSALIVMLSWLSFWLGLEATAGRITLCVTSLLALITQFSSIRRDLPPLSYIHRVDIWMVTCMCYVFASLLEFTVLIYLERQTSRCLPREMNILNVESNNQNKTSDLMHVPQKSMQNAESLRERCFYHSSELSLSLEDQAPKLREWAQTIDKASRIFFPLSFLLFNTFYWPILLS